MYNSKNNTLIFARLFLHTVLSKIVNVKPKSGCIFSFENKLLLVYILLSKVNYIFVLKKESPNNVDGGVCVCTIVVDAVTWMHSTYFHFDDFGDPSLWNFFRDVLTSLSSHTFHVLLLVAIQDEK